MCGISGVLNFDPTDHVEAAMISNMAAALAHRGPDDEGTFVDGQVGLGFRRLSIIDLAGGGQPIFNEDRSAAIVFNGEIYNYRELKATLESNGHVFQTRSDTETILHAYEQFGDDCVEHLRGMFGFAIWDRRKKRLLLARDRLGVKPLYYHLDQRCLAFASEIKALLELPGIQREVDDEAFDQYLSLRYVPGPRTAFKKILRLQPGHLLVADRGGVRTRRYWDIPSDSVRYTMEQSVERFRSELDESVRLRLISDVPLGVFLSGGIDSSAILAVASRLAGRGLKTFSVGYEGSHEDQESNEFEYARLAAQAFGSEHYEYRLTAREFETFIPSLVWHLDEPMADPSCIPLYYISKLAREHVTVILSGEGADELLAGYSIYQRMLKIDRIARRIPGISWLAPGLARLAPSEAMRHYIRIAGKPLSGRYQGVFRGLSVECRDDLIGQNRRRRADQQLLQVFQQHYSAVEDSSTLSQLLYVDSKVWLPDDLLLKADKMTMANGLELRVPFLDHKLVEFASTLPDDHKINTEQGKVLLRRVLQGVVPDPILHRPKKGFPVPLASWLRGPLRGFVQDTLSARALERFVERKAVSRIIDEHHRGQDRSMEIWTLMVFEFWRQCFIAGGATRRCAA